ncbi:MAG TPA: diol dehydratase small subunit [Solirubrobacter sp.]|nr:diol dehydratase small subunit [Solirubrobacter sp.]
MSELSTQVEQLARERGLDISPDVVAEAVKRALAALGEPAAPPSGNGKLGLSAERDYPLAAKRPDLVQSATGKHLDAITLEKVIAGEITFEDIKPRPETLEYQAQIAESAGRPSLATNLRRAAEMTRIPDARVLEIYNALRPYRSTKQQLLDIADELESQYQATVCAGLVREAAEVYDRRGRLAT